MNEHKSMNHPFFIIIISIINIIMIIYSSTAPTLPQYTNPKTFSIQSDHHQELVLIFCSIVHFVSSVFLYLTLFLLLHIHYSFIYISIARCSLFSLICLLIRFFVFFNNTNTPINSTRASASTTNTINHNTLPLTNKTSFFDFV